MLSFEEIDAKEFADFSAKAKQGSFLQSAEMSELLLLNAWRTTFIAVTSDQQIKMAALLISKNMTGGKHFEIQYGPVYEDYDEKVEQFFYQSLKDYAKTHGALELLAIPNVDYQRFDSQGKPISPENDTFVARLTQLGYTHTGLETGYNARGESTWHYVKDLSSLSDEKSLMKSYTKDGQYSIKKTRQFGIRVRPLHFDELDKFKKITSETSERRGYNDHDLSYYQSLYKTFGHKAEFLIAEINFSDYEKSLKSQISSLKEKITRSQSPRKEKQKLELEDQLKMQGIRLKEAQQWVASYGTEDIVLAGSLFIYGVSETIYLFSGSYEAFKKLYAPFAIQHYVMLKSLSAGIPSYNFFGVQGVFDGSDGVLYFKQNFAGYIVRKVGYFYYWPSPIKYKLINTLKKILGRK